MPEILDPSIPQNWTTYILTIHTGVYLSVTGNREGLLKNLTVLKDVRAKVRENSHNALDAVG